MKDFARVDRNLGARARQRLLAENVLQSAIETLDGVAEVCVALQAANKKENKKKTKKIIQNMEKRNTKQTIIHEFFLGGFLRSKTNLLATPWSIVLNSFASIRV
jgi:hypothetical protein